MKKRSSLSQVEKDAAFLADIVSESRDIAAFTLGMELDAFLSDRLVKKAVTKCLESIAEATKSLTPTLKSRHPDVQWKQVAGFRDFAAHHYWELDYGLVWDVVKQHLPRLMAAVATELEGLS